MVYFFMFSVSSCVSLFDLEVISLSFWLSLSYSSSKSIFKLPFRCCSSVVDVLYFSQELLLLLNCYCYLILLKSLFVPSKWSFSEIILFFFFPPHFSDEDHRQESYPKVSGNPLPARLQLSFFSYLSMLSKHPSRFWKN